MRRFEQFLREQAADYIKTQVHRANDPSPCEEPPDTTSGDVRETKLLWVVRRLLKHADEDFSGPAFVRMVASARRDTRRYWQFACCYWSRTLGIAVDEIDLPENIRELESEFWHSVDAVINEALGEHVGSPMKGARHKPRASGPGGKR
jgi:hypothetical protein